MQNTLATLKDSLSLVKLNRLSEAQEITQRSFMRTTRSIPSQSTFLFSGVRSRFSGLARNSFLWPALSAAVFALTALSARALPVITNVVETGGDNEATDTVTAKWSGITFTNGVAGEFQTPFKVPLFGEDVPAFVDRTHQWNGAATNIALPSYLVGGEYIMSGNDNRDNASYKLEITVSQPANVYMLVDNRLTDNVGDDPPESGKPLSEWTVMKWLGTEGFVPVVTGANRKGDKKLADEVGYDEGGDGVGPGVALNQWASVYVKKVPAGTFSIFQADNAGRNMYGVVVQPVREALFVYAGTPMNASDLVVSNRLALLGFTVTAQLAPTSATTQAAGKQLVVVSSTISSGDVAAKFKEAGVPVIAWENSIFDDMLWTLNGGSDHGTIATQQNVEIVNATHPLAGGLSGTVQVVSTARTLTFGLPNANATVIARSTDGNNRAVLWAYDKNAPLIDGNSKAAQRGVGMLLDNDTAQSATEALATLFDAAVSWATSDTSPAAIKQQPANVTVTENPNSPPPASFSAVVTGELPYTFQWKKNGADIKGATGRSYTTGGLSASDTGAKFSVVVKNSGGTVSSSDAILTVNPDTTAPTLVSVSTLGNPNGLTVTFSEPVSEASALSLGNYFINGGASISAVAFGANSSTVVLTTSTLVEGNSYALFVKDIQDRAAKANTIAPNPSLGSVDQLRGKLLVETYTGISGTAISALTDNPKYINSTPDRVGFITNFNYSPNIDNYGAKVSGYFIAPSNGVYRFFLRSDDASQLFLNTDSVNSTDPAGKVMIARENGCCAAYLATGTQTSTDIPLVGGQRYYIEGLLKEGGGGDYIQVAFREKAVTGAPPNTEFIPSQFLTAPTGPIAITSQPVSITAGEQGQVTLSVVATGAGPYSYQWSSNGAPIKGATGASYTITSASLAQSGAIYSVKVSNGFSSATSGDAVVTVTADGTAPTLVSAIGSGSLAEATLSFSETVSSATATNAANYTLSGGATVSGARLLGDGKTVVLATSAQTPGTAYTVTVNGIKDTSAAGNSIAANSTATFTAWVLSPGFLLREVFSNIGGGVLVADLTNNAKFPSNPDVREYVSLFETPVDSADNYGEKVSGYVIPSETGNYVFYVCSDDGSALFLSTDENPANKVQIAREPTWNNSRQWLATTRRNATTPENRSAPIALTAGKRYYVEALMKEGGGGDNLGVTWQLPSQKVAPANGTPPLGGSVIATYANPDGADITITQQPANVTVLETSPLPTATLKVTATAKTAASTNQTILYQWQKNGVDIAGANSSSYSTPGLTPADNGAKYRAVLSIPAKTLTSGEAVVTVNRDTTPPTVVSANSYGRPNAVTVMFSEAVADKTATNAANYSINGGPVATATKTGANTVELTTGAAAPPPPPPPVTLVGINDKQMWSYENTGKDLGTAWKDKAFDDSAWPKGAALLAFETGATAEPIRTQLKRTNSAGAFIKTDYFRTHFTFTGDATKAKLSLRHVVDDGVALYLNGTEVYRFFLPATGPITATTDADPTDHENKWEGPFDIPASALVAGDNVLAAEVHQRGATSSDVVFGLELISTAAAAPAPTVAGTLMEFNFNEGSGTTVASTDGTLVGTLNSTNTPTTLPVFSTDTPSGLAGDYSLQFALGQKVTVPDPNKVLALDTNNPSFTLQAWVKFATPAARSVFFYNNGPGGAVSASVFTNRTAFVTTLGKKDQDSKAAIPDDGKWHHYAVVHENAKEIRFYVDGVLADTQAYTSSVIFTRTNQVFYLGSEPAGGLQFVGSLDRLIYSKGMLASDQLDSKAVPAAGVQKLSRTYGIGVNFGADEPNNANTAGVAAVDVAGIPGIAQANWNNVKTLAGVASGIVADNGGKSEATSMTVQWSSANTWASTGRSENNNGFATNANRTLMTGYLDTPSSGTTTVSIFDVPPQLSKSGYDVYVYALGGVPGRGGAYRVLDASSGAVLKDYVRAQSPTNPSNYFAVPVLPVTANPGIGNYLVFKGLTASNIKIEATTASGLGFSGTPRAPINAVQLVAPATVPVSAGLSVAVTGVTDTADQPNSVAANTQVVVNTAPASPTDFGQVVNGYQDDFSSLTLNPNWKVHGPATNIYKLRNGYLSVTNGTGDPNHLLYEAAGYHKTNQELLVRIRINQFGNGDPVRAGVGVAVSADNANEGINYHFRNEGTLGIHTEFLDDKRAWGPELNFKWASNTWYWVRLKYAPNTASGQPDAFAKIWRADGTAPEPADWLSTWDRHPAEARIRSGFAGITGGSSDGIAVFDVDYILIKAAGLPSIKVAGAENSPLIAGDDAIETTEGKSVSVSALKLLANDSGAGDVLTVTGVAGASAQGGSVALAKDIVTYTPKAGFTGSDSFRYAVASASGATTTAKVTVTVNSAGSASQNLVGIVRGDLGVVVAQFLGIPNRTYKIQASTDLKTWVDIGTATASRQGVVNFIDLEGGKFAQRFYRTVSP